MRIVVGLGNPGLLYRTSRHNAGYQALDALAKSLGVLLIRRGFEGVYGESSVNGERVILVKPKTYMNRSGDCVQKILHFYKAAPEDLIVLYDDIDLPTGSLRIRTSGSPGTHNGMRSVLACVNSTNVPRVRIGVGRANDRDLKDYVLEKPAPEDRKAIASACEDAADAAYLMLTGRTQEAQARYNKKHEGANA